MARTWGTYSLVPTLGLRCSGVRIRGRVNPRLSIHALCEGEDVYHYFIRNGWMSPTPHSSMEANKWFFSLFACVLQCIRLVLASKSELGCTPFSPTVYIFGVRLVLYLPPLVSGIHQWSHLCMDFYFSFQYEIKFFHKGLSAYFFCINLGSCVF